jgi:hypothetical protein
MGEESLITIYRKNASYCRVKAARTRDAEDKAKWLEFADGWEMLAAQLDYPRPVGQTPRRAWVGLGGLSCTPGLDGQRSEGTM